MRRRRRILHDSQVRRRLPGLICASGAKGSTAWHFQWETLMAGKSNWRTNEVNVPDVLPRWK